MVVLSAASGWLRPAGARPGPQAGPNESAATEPTRPPALRPGDTIAIVAPAGVVVERRVHEAARNLERRGYRVRIFPGVLESEGYLAGRDNVRVRDLHDAFSDPRVRLVLCARGGYGSPRLLELIDYDLLRRHPKIFVGYSDISALHVAIGQKANLVTFHGPMAMSDFSGKAGLAPYSTRHFWSLLEEPSADGASGLPELYSDWGAGASKRLGERRTVAPGRAEGRLTGGNLSTIVTTLGTPFEIDTRAKILFLEDVNEEPFRIDRMLCQLHLAGKLKVCRGILVGGFVRCVPSPGRPSLSVDQVLVQYLGGLNIPVLAGFPAGHLPDQATLPMGSRVRLDASARTLTLLEYPVAVKREAR